MSVYYILTTKPTRCTTSQIYFWNRIIHVSDRSCVHHQESNTVHTAIGICHTGNADCLLELVHLVGFIVGIYHDARPFECQITLYYIMYYIISFII
jgi:hypothetical protein